MTEKEELKYFDMLYDFMNVVVRLNNSALNGYSGKSITKRMRELIPAFTALCGVDAESNVDMPKVEQAKKPGRKPKQEPPKEEPEPLPNNFMKEENGWGLCPVCRKRMIKVTGTTKLVDFPAYCKACKAEYLVSWWNVENKDIAYARYVNDKHYVNRRDIRNEGMKGTSVQHFLHTRTSSTERVAMKL